MGSRKSCVFYVHNDIQVKCAPMSSYGTSVSKPGLWVPRNVEPEKGQGRRIRGTRAEHKNNARLPVS